VRVLLLDDERSVRRSFHLLLEEAGHEVRSSSTSEDALRRLACGDFDVAVIDMVMASGGGRRLLDALRERHPAVAVVAITGNPAVFAELEADPGLDQRLVKPVTRDVLLDAVSRAHASRLMRQSQTRRRSYPKLEGPLPRPSVEPTGNVRRGA
jgi:DNA-binding NtrC family response regulator